MVITSENNGFITSGQRPRVINLLFSQVMTITTSDIFHYFCQPCNNYIHKLVVKWPQSENSIRFLVKKKWIPKEMNPKFQIQYWSGIDLCLLSIALSLAYPMFDISWNFICNQLSNTYTLYVNILDRLSYLQTLVIMHLFLEKRSIWIFFQSLNQSSNQAAF